MTLRVVAGRARGRRLSAPPGSSTRPTAERTRESLFSTLHSLLGGFDGLRVLDLFAGSGALGLETLSRGASAVVLVESEARAQRTLRDNVRALGLPGARVAPLRVERFCASDPPAEAPFDLVLADPPYVHPDRYLDRALARLVGGGFLAEDAVLVVERSARTPGPTWPAGTAALRDRRHGEAHLWFAEVVPPEVVPPEVVPPEVAPRPGAGGGAAAADDVSGTLPR